MKIIIIGLIALESVTSFATPRMKNPCWSTRLSVEEKIVCSTCNSVVQAMVKDKELNPCQKEQLALDECLADFEYCLNYNDLLNERDNCATKLVKACFNNL